VKANAFGLSKSGLRRSARYLQSADSMAWSLSAQVMTSGRYWFWS
jgi:hypothetical protein